MESRVLCDREEADLRRYVRALIRRWPLLLVCAGVAAASGLLYSGWLERNPTYQATALAANALVAAALGLVVGVATALLLEHEQGSKGAGEQGAGEQGSRGAKEQGSKGEGEHGAGH